MPRKKKTGSRGPKDPWKALSKKLSKRGQRPGKKSKQIEQIRKRLKDGGYRQPDGSIKNPLSANKHLKEIIKMIELGASPKEVPVEVSRRFAWKEAWQEVRDCAEQAGVDPKLVQMAVDPKRKKPGKKG